jgi:hypothetical protein
MRIKGGRHDSKCYALISGSNVTETVRITNNIYDIGYLCNDLEGLE